MMSFAEAYSLAMEEIARGYHLKNVELENFDDPYEKIEDQFIIAVTNGKELIVRVKKGDRVGFFRVVNLSYMLKKHNAEIRKLLLAGLLYYDAGVIPVTH